MDVIAELTKLTKHKQIRITKRGNSAIKAAIKLAKGKILVPEEGGWLSYKKSDFQVVKCRNSRIDLYDLEKKLTSKNYKALIYHNPGGYFAQQPMKEIYQLCQKYNCLTIMDVSGSIGTELCNGDFADVLVCSFGKWKLIDVGGTGFISCKNKQLFKQLTVEAIEDPRILAAIADKIDKLPSRINYLLEKRRKVISDLKDHQILNREDIGFVVVVATHNEVEKGKIIEYCNKHELEYTECPRYIRVNKPAISIEVKRL